MEGYGTKYNGSDILDLSNSGFIEEKEPITMLVYKSLYAQDENSETYVKPVAYEELLQFYSPEKNPGRMHNLLTTNNINKNFSDLHSELLENISRKDKENYISDLIDETKSLASTPLDYSNDLLEYNKASIIPDTYLSRNITSEFLINKYIAKEISLSRIMQIYESDPNYFKALETLLTPAEIENEHKNGNLEDDSLLYLPKAKRIAYLQKSKTNLSTIMYLFLHCDGISISELQTLLSQNNVKENLDFYIDSGSSISKIKELYENYLIDYGCIKALINSGIIKESDVKKYQFEISKDNTYNSIQNAKSIEINNVSLNIPSSTTGTFIGTQPDVTTAINKTNKLYKILEDTTSTNSINQPIIHHKNNKNDIGFLNEYKIHPLKPVNLVAFVPPKPTKSTYIMPYQEMAYIINNQALPDTLLENPFFCEVKSSEKLHEDVLRTIYQFESSKDFLKKLGYSENLDFDEALKIMTNEYIKIKTKGEN